jgi:hypothetical protein
MRWCQILYNDFGILSIDIELIRDDNNPERNFDEGRRGDTPAYSPAKVKSDKYFESGVLEPDSSNTTVSATKFA